MPPDEVTPDDWLTPMRNSTDKDKDKGSTITYLDMGSTRGTTNKDKDKGSTLVS